MDKLIQDNPTQATVVTTEVPTKKTYTLGEMREARGITKSHVARLSGVAIQTISNWEKGRTAPSIKDLLLILHIYKRDLDELNLDIYKEAVNQQIQENIAIIKEF